MPASQLTGTIVVADAHKEKGTWLWQNIGGPPTVAVMLAAAGFASAWLADDAMNAGSRYSPSDNMAINPDHMHSVITIEAYSFTLCPTYSMNALAAGVRYIFGKEGDRTHRIIRNT